MMEELQAASKILQKSTVTTTNISKGSTGHFLGNAPVANLYTTLGFPPSGYSNSTYGEGSYSLPPLFKIKGEPLKATTYPFKKPSVFKLAEDSVYQLTSRAITQETPDAESNNPPLHIQFVDPSLDHSTAVFKGVEVGQLLIASIDYLKEHHREEDIYRIEAIKHLEFALAYLDKDSLEQNKLK